MSGKEIGDLVSFGIKDDQGFSMRIGRVVSEMSSTLARKRKLLQLNSKATGKILEIVCLETHQTFIKRKCCCKEYQQTN